MSCKYNNCKHCGYKSECEIYKENTELEEKISILLSCKNCPDNKGGYICQKEYEDKCLAQKIQYIKELKAEKEYSATLRKEIDEYINTHTLCAKYKELQKENTELQQKWLDESYEKAKLIGQLNKAKGIIRDLLFHLGNTFIVSYTSKEESITKAEQFLGELD